jgi:hypothetical protein
MANFLDAKTLSMIQAAQNARSANRSGKSGPRLLDDGENNIGNATTLMPQVLPPVTNPYVLPPPGGSPLVLPWTKVKQGTPPRVLNLTGASKAGQSMTVVMTAARLANSAGVAGPVTGIIEFGNGTQNTRIEFDIPFGPYAGLGEGNPLFASQPGTQPEDGIATIQVPTGMIRAYARYDNAYLTPNIRGYVFGEAMPAIPPPPSIPVSPAVPAIAPASGPFPPNQVYPEDTVTNANPNPNSCPAVIKAFANYFGRIHSKLYKTLYLYNGNASAPVPFGSSIQKLEPNTTYVIPAGAKTVSVNRTPFSSGMTVLLGDLTSVSGEGIGGYIVIPANQASPVIPITGNQCVIGLFSNGDVSAVSLTFEIGF